MRRDIGSQFRRLCIAFVLAPAIVSGCGNPRYNPGSIDRYILRVQPDSSASRTAAADVNTEGKPLTLDSCIRIGLDRNPLRRAAQEGVTAAQAVARGANSAYYPQVDASAGYSRWERPIFLPSGIPIAGAAGTVGPLNDWVANLNLHYTLFDSGKRRAELLTATALKSAAQEQVEEVRLDIALNVHQAYYGYLAAQDALEIAEKNLASAANHLRIAEEKRVVGVIPDAEVVRIRVEVANDRLALVRAKGLTRVAVGRLNAAMGLPVEMPMQVQVDEGPISAPNQIDLTAKLNEAMHLRPEPRAALHRVAAAENRVASAKSSFGPEVRVQGMYGREDTTFFPNANSWLAGLSIQVPIYDQQLRSSRLAQARAELAQQEAQIQHLLLTVQQEVWTAHAQLVEAHEAVAAAEAVVNSARESARLVTERYREGFATTNDLLDSQADLVRAEGNNAQARWDYRIANAVFERAVGNLLPQPVPESPATTETEPRPASTP